MKHIKEVVKTILRKLNMFDYTYRMYAWLRGWSHGSTESRAAKFYCSFDKFVEDAKNRKSIYSQKTIIFYGYMITSRKRLIFKIMRQLIDRYPNCRTLLFANRGHLSVKRFAMNRDKLVPSDVIVLPEKSKTYESLDLELTDEMRDLIASKTYLRNAIENAQDTHRNAKPNYIEVLLCEYYRCYEAVLDNINVAAVVIWNAFKYFHYLFSEMCKERGVKVAYAEFGSLPGTFVFDTDGQMGESWPAVHFEEFNQLPVTEEECIRSEKIIETLRESGLNRNEQPEHIESDEVLTRLKPGKPIVLFAGQCDRDSGLIPYTEITRKFHSPYFSSSNEGMIYVAELAKKHDWNYIFKPHPLVKNEVDITKLPQNVIFIKDININDIIDISDVVVTILSSTVYVSLIRETATVMLGYNQIHGKGCAYEALAKCDIENVLLEALEKGYTSEQKNAFIKHIAQMEKYYLYSDGAQKEGMEYGRSVEKAVNFFEQFFVEEECGKAVEERGKSIFICSTLQDLISSIHVKNGIPNNQEAELLLLNFDKSLECCTFDKITAIFSDVVFLNTPEIELDVEMTDEKEIRKKEFLAKIRQEIGNTSYSELYICSLSSPFQMTVQAFLCENPKCDVHLIDTCKEEYTSFKQIHKQIFMNGKLFSYEEKMRFEGAIKEIMLYDLYRFDRGISINYMPALIPISNSVGENAIVLIDILNYYSVPELMLIVTALNLRLPMKEILKICNIVKRVLEG